MSSAIEIANSALIKLGSPAIVSLNDDRKAAKLCKNRIYPCVRAVLRMHPWNCVIERDTLSPTTTTPNHTYEYEHTLPSACLRVLEINPINEDDYRIEGNKVRTDTDTIEVKYIKDPGEALEPLDDLCAEACALYLAWDICFALTESRGLKTDVWKDFKTMLGKAKSADGKEDPYLEMEAELWLESRTSGSRGPMRANR